MWHDFTEKQNEEDDCYGGMVLVFYLVVAFGFAALLGVAWLIHKAVL